MRISYLKTEFCDIEDLTEFQGDLKLLAPADAKKLRKQIEEQGFSAPFIIWENGDKKYILDGHQRLRVLRKMRKGGIEIPKIPCNFVNCKSEKEAKFFVLALTSQFGKMTINNLVEFAEVAEIQLMDVVDNFRFPEIDPDALSDIIKNVEPQNEPLLTTDYTIDDKVKFVLTVPVDAADKIKKELQDIVIRYEGVALYV